MTDAINAKSDVLNAQELDAVSGGTIMLPLGAFKVLDFRIWIPTFRTGGDEPGPVGGRGPAEMFQQIMQQI